MGSGSYMHVCMIPVGVYVIVLVCWVCRRARVVLGVSAGACCAGCVVLAWSVLEVGAVTLQWRRSLTLWAVRKERSVGALHARPTVCKLSRGH